MIQVVRPGQLYKATQFDKLGGEAGVRQLVDHFYDAMGELDAAKPIRQMHATNLDEAREKLFLFLCGWLGGPSLYIEKYGHPRLRARHLPFQIGDEERDQWLLCMQTAIHKMQIEPARADELMQAFFQTADFMRNS